MILSMKDIGRHPYYYIALLHEYNDGTYDSVTCPWYDYIRNVI